MYVHIAIHACMHTYILYIKLYDIHIICISIAGFRKTKMPTSSGVSGRIGGLGLFVFRRRTTVIGSSHGVTALAFGSLWGFIGCLSWSSNVHPMFNTQKSQKRCPKPENQTYFLNGVSWKFRGVRSVYPELKRFRVCPSINPSGYLCAPSSWEEAAASLQLTLWQFLIRPIDVFPYVKKQQHLQWVLWHWERLYLWRQPDDIDMLPNSSFQSLWYFTASL